MLPAHLAENIRKQVLFSLQSTFDFRGHRFGQDRMLPATHPRPLPAYLPTETAGIKAIVLYPMNALAAD